MTTAIQASCEASDRIPRRRRRADGGQYAAVQVDRLDQGEPGSRLPRRSQRVRGGQPLVVSRRGRANHPGRTDAMVAFGRPKGRRGSYKQWEEGNIAPQVVFETLSPGNRPDEMERKFKFYEQYGVEEYYIYDPDDGTFEAWLRRGTPAGQGQGCLRVREPSPADSIRAGRRAGQLEDLRPRRQACFRLSPRSSNSGTRLPQRRQRARRNRRSSAACRDRTPACRGRSERPSAERQRADRLAAKLRDLGIDPDCRMKLGYNTNGLAHHRLVDAIELLADEGYQSVAITLDAGALDPYDEPASLRRQIEQVRVGTRPSRPVAGDRDRRSLICSIRASKHDPTLMDPDPARRAVRSDFLHRAIDLAEAIGAEAVSLWSGRAPRCRRREPGLDRLARRFATAAGSRRASRAFHWHSSPSPACSSTHWTGSPGSMNEFAIPLFQLTVDLGHVHCPDEGDIPALLRTWGPRIVNIHIEDMVHGIHEHLMFGEGTMDFPPICRALPRDRLLRRRPCRIEPSQPPGRRGSPGCRRFLGHCLSGMPVIEIIDLMHARAIPEKACPHSAELGGAFSIRSISPSTFSWSRPEVRHYPLAHQRLQTPKKFIAAWVLS